MGKIFREAITGNYAFWICLIISIFLLIGGAITPPAFVIDASIFKATGWLFAFAALGSFSRAVDKGLDASIKKGDFSFNVGRPRKRHEYPEEFEQYDTDNNILDPSESGDNL